MSNLKFKRIIFCGEKELSVKCLDYLKKKFKVKIIGICTRKVSKVWWGKQFLREYAKKNKIKIIKTKKIKANQADLLISVLFPFIIKKKVLDKFKLSINLHQAPLPKYRGCNLPSHAIFENSNFFGSTLHKMNEKIDAGDIIAQKKFKLKKNITAKELYEYNNEIAFELFKKTIRKILTNKFNLLKQKNIKGKVYTRNSLKNKEISFNMSKKEIWNKVRGYEFFPFEPCYLKIGKEKIYLLTKPWKFNHKSVGNKPWESKN